VKYGIKFLFAIVLVWAISLANLSCSNATANTEKDGKIKVGIVFDIGGKNDRSFNAAAWV
jgi:basic membrane protein A and related proteins